MAISRALASPSFSRSPPRSSPPVIPAQPLLGQSAVTEHPRWPYKRRLSAPPDLQPKATIRQVNKKARTVQGDRAGIHIVDDVDGKSSPQDSFGSPPEYLPQS